MTGIPVARVNLALPVDTMILIERECDKRGINRVQFIKEAIHDKLKVLAESEVNLNQLKDEIMELKKIILLSIDK